MRKPKPISAYLKEFGGLTFIILVLVILKLIAGHQAPVNHQQQDKEKSALSGTLAAELGRLAGPLYSLGFNLKNIKTQCAANSVGSGDYCSASLNSYVKYKDEAARSAIDGNAQKLSDQLTANGWKQRADYPTTKWFDNIAKGVDYQPDQLNTKTIRDISCTVDFFTSFSKPAVPAVTLSAFCHKGTAPYTPID